MTHFVKDNFQVTRSDFGVFNITHLNAAGQAFPFKLYVLSEPIKFVPDGTIPSFYMVNKFGDIYTETEYLLIPYIRFVISDPYADYEGTNKTNYDGTGEMPRTDYRNDPLHPYWIGGVNLNGSIMGVQPNKNARRNLAQIMDVYLLAANNASMVTTHGIQGEESIIPILGSIGQGIVPDEGTLKNNMWLPANTQYLQASLNGQLNGEEPNHVLQLKSRPNANRTSALYGMRLTLPEISTQANNPFILPPMFTNLHSYFTYYSQDRSNIYTAGIDCYPAISTLTFGVQKA